MWQSKRSTTGAWRKFLTPAETAWLDMAERKTAAAHETIALFARERQKLQNRATQRRRAAGESP